MFGVNVNNSIPSSVHGGYAYGMDTHIDTQGAATTPGGRSNGESEGEKDPFLSLLEQLAENEQSRGGPSELDFFLGAGNG